MSLRGQVKWFDPKKGYGFIIGPTGQDVFVHYSQIRGDGFRLLKDGEMVDYELVEGEKGAQAREVVRSAAPPSGDPASNGKPATGNGTAAAPSPAPLSSGYSNRNLPHLNTQRPTAETQ